MGKRRVKKPEDQKPEDWAYTVPDSGCPNCGKVLDRASETLREKKKPKPGDCSVCMYCCAVLVFDDNLRMRRATLRERTEGGAQLEHVVRTIEKFNRAWRRQN